MGPAGGGTRPGGRALRSQQTVAFLQPVPALLAAILVIEFIYAIVGIVWLTQYYTSCNDLTAKNVTLGMLGMTSWGWRGALAGQEWAACSPLPGALWPGVGHGSSWASSVSPRKPARLPAVRAGFRIMAAPELGSGWLEGTVSEPHSGGLVAVDSNSLLPAPEPRR